MKLLFTFTVFIGLFSIVCTSRLDAERRLGLWDKSQLTDIVSGALAKQESSAKVRLEIERDDDKKEEQNASNSIWLTYNGQRVLEVTAEKDDSTNNSQQTDEKLKVHLDNRKLAQFKDNHFHLIFEAFSNKPADSLKDEFFLRLQFYLQSYGNILLDVKSGVTEGEVIQKVQSLFENLKLNLKRSFGPKSSKHTEKAPSGELVEFKNTLLYYDIGMIERAIRVFIKSHALKSILRIDILGETYNFELNPGSHQSLDQVKDGIQTLLTTEYLDFINDPWKFAVKVNEKVKGCEHFTINPEELSSSEDQDSDPISKFIKGRNQSFEINFPGSSNDETSENANDTTEIIKDSRKITKPKCGLANAQIIFIIFNLQSFRYLQVKVSQTQYKYHNENFIAMVPDNDPDRQLTDFLNFVNADLIALGSSNSMIVNDEEVPASNENDWAASVPYSSKDLRNDLMNQFGLKLKDEKQSKNRLTGRNQELYYKSTTDSHAVISVEHHPGGSTTEYNVITFLRPTKNGPNGKSKNHEVIYLPVNMSKFYKDNFFAQIKEKLSRSVDKQ